MANPEIEAFLSHLAVDLNASAATQNQAFNALLFLYKEVLKKELDNSIDVKLDNNRCYTEFFLYNQSLGRK